MTGEHGRLTVSGDRAVLTFERRLPYPVETVWTAITDPVERAQWFGETTIDAREGGTTPPPAARTTSTGLASSSAQARRPTSTRHRQVCTLPMSRPATNSADGSRW
jgi:hypothetical protein